ncbi:hypothetical protein ACFLZ7_01455 [Nanoarchaeota archaeon]
MVGDYLFIQTENIEEALERANVELDPPGMSVHGVEIKDGGAPKPIEKKSDKTLDARMLECLKKEGAIVSYVGLEVKDASKDKPKSVPDQLHQAVIYLKDKYGAHSEGYNFVMKVYDLTIEDIAKNNQ